MYESLKISHSKESGLFSCCSVKLATILAYFRLNKNPPQNIDYQNLFLLYNNGKNSIHHIFFDENVEDILNVNDWFEFPIRPISEGIQFDKYTEINFNLSNKWIKKYFTPSDTVKSKIELFHHKYNFNNICSVFYRGNDKSKETQISSYNTFINQAGLLLDIHPSIRFHIQTDEIGFYDAFMNEFPNNSFACRELPMIAKCSTNVTETLPASKRLDFAINFLSMVYILSSSKFLITHSGNCGLWAVLFRGNANNVYQILNDKWVS